MNLQPGADESLDLMMRGRVKLLQSKKGYRTSVDAMMLAWFAWTQAPHAQRVADFGAGSGLVALTLALVSRPPELTLVERQQSLATRAHRNLKLNAVSGTVRHHDLAEGPVPGLHDLDLAMSNPPYFTASGRILPTHPERRDAHYESSAGVETFCAAAAAALGEAGVLCMVYPVEGLDRLIRAFDAAGLGQVQVCVLHHRYTTRPPVRVLLAGRRGPLDVVAIAPVTIHPQKTKDHTYTQAIETFIQRMPPRAAS